MNALKPNIASAAPTHSLVVLIATFFLLFSCNLWAETTVTATPDAVNADELQPIVVQIKKVDGTLDAELMGKVELVRIGDREAKITKQDGQGITVAPPKMGLGSHSISLFGNDRSKAIATGHLQYLTGDLNISTEAREELRRDKLAASYWYFLIVILMFLALLFPFVGAIVAAIRGGPSLSSRPLGLPTGSFRSILAFSLVTYLGFYVLTSILSVTKFMPPDFLLGIVATVIGFYFGTRSGDEGESNLKSGTVRGVVRQGVGPARGAIVKFKRLADNTEPYSRISDVDGRFELTGATAGRYTVSASYAGAVSSDAQEISITEGSDHEIEIILKGAGAGAGAGAGSGTTGQSGIVEGVVMKSDGTTAQGATVVLSVGGAEKYQKSSDSNGKYRIDGVATGEYEITASLSPLGSSDSVKVKVTSGGRQSVELRLK